jgi:hypothetical protein
MKNLLKTKKDKAQFKKWINALRSGKYQQTQGALQDFDGYCCLGVACKVLIPKNELKLQANKLLKGFLPNYQSKAPEWLKQIDRDFQIETTKFLTTLNDNYDYSFDEIADLLEIIYIHEIV